MVHHGPVHSLHRPESGRHREQGRGGRNPVPPRHGRRHQRAVPPQAVRPRPFVPGRNVGSPNLHPSRIRGAPHGRGHKAGLARRVRLHHPAIPMHLKFQGGAGRGFRIALPPDRNLRRGRHRPGHRLHRTEARWHREQVRGPGVQSVPGRDSQGRRDGVPPALQADGSRTRRRRERSRHEERGRFLRDPGDGGAVPRITRPVEGRRVQVMHRPVRPRLQDHGHRRGLRQGPAPCGHRPGRRRPGQRPRRPVALGQPEQRLRRQFRVPPGSGARPGWPSPAVPGAGYGTVPPNVPPDRCRRRRLAGYPIG